MEGGVSLLVLLASATWGKDGGAYLSIQPLSFVKRTSIVSSCCSGLKSAWDMYLVKSAFRCGSRMERAVGKCEDGKDWILYHFPLVTVTTQVSTHQ